MPCNSSHPQNSALLCETTPSNHRFCTAYDSSLDEYVDWPNPEYVDVKTRGRKDSQARLEAAAARVAPSIHVVSADASTLTGIEKGFAASEIAAKRWTDNEKQRVMDAIVTVAEQNDEFTSDAIWEELAGRVPVTKGLTALLRIAMRRGILDSTGKTEISSRGGKHDHGQRLTVWYSLIQKKD